MSERMIKILVPLWVFAVLATQGSAAKLVVDDSGGGDYASAADAVCDSIPGDTLLIRAGVYEEGDITLCTDSPRMPGVSGWGAAVGAEEQGCSACGSTVVPASWGVIKAMYMGDVRLAN